MASMNHPRDSNDNNIQPTATDSRPRSHPIPSFADAPPTYCSTMHGHGLGLGNTTAVAPLRASPPTPPPPGTTTNTHPGSPVSLCFKLGRRPNPPSVLFLSSFFLSPILVSVPTPDFHPPGPSWLPVAVSLHELAVLGASSRLGIVACLLLAAIEFLFAETFPFYLDIVVLPPLYTYTLFGSVHETFTPWLLRRTSLV